MWFYKSYFEFGLLFSFFLQFLLCLLIIRIVFLAILRFGFYCLLCLWYLAVPRLCYARLFTPAQDNPFVFFWSFLSRSKDFRLRFQPASVKVVYILKPNKGTFIAKPKLTTETKTYNNHHFRTSDMVEPMVFLGKTMSLVFRCFFVVVFFHSRFFEVTTALNRVILQMPKDFEKKWVKAKTNSLFGGFEWFLVGLIVVFDGSLLVLNGFCVFFNWFWTIFWWFCKICSALCRFDSEFWWFWTTWGLENVRFGDGHQACGCVVVRGLRCLSST